jgi:uncharacterized tellurite resistance protein B-like protein
MLNRLMALLSAPAPEGRGEDAGANLRRSAAVLLVVAARLDGHFDEEERQTIREALVERFGMVESDAEALIVEATGAAADSTDLFTLTREINSEVRYEERDTIIEMLWAVAYADGTLDDYEANLVRRVSGLLHVSDQESGAARQRVLQRLAGPSS